MELFEQTSVGRGIAADWAQYESMGRPSCPDMVKALRLHGFEVVAYSPPPNPSVMKCGYVFQKEGKKYISTGTAPGFALMAIVEACGLAHFFGKPQGEQS